MKIKLINLLSEHRKIFKRIIKHVDESLEQKELLEAHRLEFLKRSAFKAWFLSLAVLRKENIEVEERYSKICNRLRFVSTLISLMQCNNVLSTSLDNSR